MRLLGLLVIAVMAALAGGTGTALASPGTAPTTPASPPGMPALPQTGIPQLDGVLNKLAGNPGKGAPGTPGGGVGNTTPDTSQMIVVTAPKATDTTGTLTAFERGADQSWKPVTGPVKAFLGSKGIGQPQDNVSRTPEGTFGMDRAFGREANPGTKMPYTKVTKEDWWDENPKSPTYNTMVHQAKSPGGDSENLADAGPVYDYAVNIAHNPLRIPGKASGMFLHVTNNKPTQGCVAIDKEAMRKILVWLDPAKHPKIAIGVNNGKPQADEVTKSGTSKSGSSKSGTSGESSQSQSGQSGSTSESSTPESSTPKSGTPETSTPQTSTPESGSPQSTSPSGTTPPTSSTPQSQGDKIPGADALTQLLKQLVSLIPSLFGTGNGTGTGAGTGTGTGTGTN